MKFSLFSLLMYRDNPRGITGVIDHARSMVTLVEWEVGPLDHIGLRTPVRADSTHAA